MAAFALTGLSLPVLAQEAASPVPTPSVAPDALASMSPSGQTAAELELLVPAEVEGMVLAVSSFEAADILSNVESDALLQDMADLALAHDTELNRFAIAGGGSVGEAAFLSIIGGWLPGVPAAELQEAFVSIVLGATDPRLTEPGTIAGQAVTIVRADADAGPADTAYVLAVGEVVWLVIADEGSVAAAIEALGAR